MPRQELQQIGGHPAVGNIETKSSHRARRVYPDGFGFQDQQSVVGGRPVIRETDCRDGKGLIPLSTHFRAAQADVEESCRVPFTSAQDGARDGTDLPARRSPIVNWGIGLRIVLIAGLSMVPARRRPGIGCQRSIERHGLSRFSKIGSAQFMVGSIRFLPEIMADAHRNKRVYQRNYCPQNPKLRTSAFCQ